MQFFYDGQIRRYLVQTIRLLSNFLVKYGDGRLIQVPVMYGDIDRQIANILKQNSENKVSGAPKIAVYISQLEMDKERLADPTYVGKVHIRERAVDDDGVYNSSQGSNYTVERLMPSPYKLTVKADIWTVNTEQKFQILEQMLMLFNPSLEIQTSDNYIDWTSLSVVYLDDVSFSSRQIPVGQDSPIDIATLTLSMPIWISPPAKVKKLGIVNNIVMSMYTNIVPGSPGYIEGLGVDPETETGEYFDQVPTSVRVNIVNYDIVIYGGSAKVYEPDEYGSRQKDTSWVDINNRGALNWGLIIGKHPNTYVPGESKIFLLQPNNTEVVGTIALDPLDPTILNINWISDTFPSNTDIPSPNRPNSPGTFDAVIDPTTKGPNHGLPNPTVGIRYLLINSIGAGVRETLIARSRSNRIDTTVEYNKVDDVRIFVNENLVQSQNLNIDGKLVVRLLNDVAIDDVITYVINLNQDGPDSWKNNDGSDFIANTNDIIEWNGNQWQVIFDSTREKDRIYYQTNIYTGVQYKWDGVQWSKSFEGEYRKGYWRLIL